VCIFGKDFPFWEKFNDIDVHGSKNLLSIIGAENGVQSVLNPLNRGRCSANPWSDPALV
jgi:hypothetical protein